MTTAFYSHPFCKLHEMGSDHPEAPERLVAIEDHLISMRIADYLHPIEAPLATEQQLALVHTLDAINVIKNHTPTNADYYPIDGDTLLKRFLQHSPPRTSRYARAINGFLLIQ